MSNKSSNRSSRREYDTGFPDAFAEYTTSLRHPDANVNPGACISAEDIDPSKTLHRTRRSFLARHKRTVTHGIISNGSDSKRASRSTLILPTIDSAVDVGDLKHTDTNGSFGNSSKDGTDSLHGDRCSLSLTASNEDDFTDDGRHRVKLFRKWRSQKD
ncbi:uncharacterized protein GGS22DRAFT_187860 [Annulohypoxylon maeteangense]|uniref:uncharacterized protein n=1 Tax=Annulohypoxylon maeteangense TaxID=1927788 RepID=UPI002008E3B1|nr:uncharacterized protein GGS22DRAFT_187860 [Annulohypoxylon maeteangense]KAI0885575.1 hypothetical protein GGS22DRAFT_187860 [Annulohypoxylon maeteangense]